MSASPLAQALAQAVLDDLGVVVLQADAGLRVLEHAGALGVRGLVPGVDLVGRCLPDLFPELVGSEDELAAVARGESPRLDVPMINRMSGADLRYLSLIALPHPEVPDRLLLLVHDVTAEGRLDQQVMQQLNETRLLRAQLEAANARLLQLDADKSAFLRMAAHDLRAPLTVIRGYAELVVHENRPVLSQDVLDCLGVVIDRTQQMAHLIDNLLDVEKIESGVVKLDRQLLILEVLVNHVIDGLRPLLQDKKLTLRCSVSPGLPAVPADWDRLVQVLNNLVSNALKFTPTGGNVAIEAFQRDGEVVVEVSDTGIGISEADQPRLFSRFFRTDDARLRHIPGSGLGLSIVRAIVEQHGGHAFCRSRPGQGSTFGFSLPLEAAGPASARE